ncbi:cytochrome P450 [Anopheles sinensis]|uniref:Cytochrome P450 n=1 Tax=Anopheles sinensis TaxID=74873 RepID=A0A084VDQ0_ANOSI|nr:cytochrome P450 [Anopheles sinensis]
MLVWLLVIVLLTLVYYYGQRRFRYWSDRGIPHLEGSLPLGSMQGVGKEMSLNELVDQVYSRFKCQSPAAGVYFLVNPVLIVSDLDLAKRILVKDFDHFHDRGVYVNERDDPLSGHLFALGGERWRYLRNKLSPTFTSGKIKYMFGTIRDIGGELLASFDRHIDQGTPIDIKLLSQCFTCDVVGSCAFGLRCNSLQNGGSKLLEISDRLFRQSAASTIYYIATSTFPRLSRALHLPAFPGDVSSYFMELVRSTVEHREREAIERSDFLQLLMKLKNDGTVGPGEDGAEEQSSQKITLDEATAQAFVFFFAGFETSATTLAFALFLLANDSAVQERCRKEIVEVLAQHENTISYDALKEMTYLDWVINETLRLYTPAGLVMRVVTEPYRLEACNVTLETGTMVIVPLQSFHRDPVLFPNPERFDPDRFSPEVAKTRHSHAFLPFGDGPRNCIGMRFGLLEVKFGIVQVISKLRLTVNPRTVLPLQLNKSSGFPEANGGLWLDAARL